MVLGFLPHADISMKKEFNYLKVLLSQLYSNTDTIFLKKMTSGKALSLSIVLLVWQSEQKNECNYLEVLLSQICSNRGVVYVRKGQDM